MCSVDSRFQYPAHDAMPVFQVSNSDSLIPDSVDCINFTCLHATSIKLVLQWRNHESVRKWMLNNSIISISEHRAFIESLRNSTDKCYFMVQLNKTPIGVVDFYRINSETGICYYGYYLKPENIGSSLGLLLEFIVAEYAFSDLKMSTLMAETMPNNTQALQLHQKFGFRDGIINHHGLKESILQKEDWENVRSGIFSLIKRLVA